MLPLDGSKIKSLALIGNNANRCIFGHYSGTPAHPPVSVLGGIHALAGNSIDVRHVNWRYRHADRFVVMEGDEIFPASGAAGTKGFYGEYFTNSELNGNPALTREDTAINFHWQWLMDPCVPGEKFSIRWTASLNPRTIVVIESGSSAAVPWLHDHVPAIIEAWYPGEQGGRAIAETLFGVNNPGGRLPLTFYRATSDLPALDDYELIGGRTYRYARKPLYAFGHGLSYTTFKYSNFAVKTNAKDMKAMISFSVDVTNTGLRNGDEVVQIYVQGPAGQEGKKLVAFERIHLNAGKTRRVKGNVATKWLETFDETSRSMRIQSGQYEIAVGSSSDNILAAQEVILPEL